MKKTLFITLIATLTLLCGCYYDKEVVENELENENSTVLSGALYGDNQTTVTDELEVRGEDFTLQVTYDTGDLPLNKWRVTSNKNISMEVKTVGLPAGYEVHIEHVHADICLKSTEPQLDGISHDSMDDSDHRVPTKGFPIGNNISYHNVFSIEGYNEQFYTMWGHTFGDFGYVSSSYERLTERNIRNMDCYAEKLMVVYDIVITRPDGTEYVRSAYSEVLIPLIGEIETVRADSLTGEVVE